MLLEGVFCYALHFEDLDIKTGSTWQCIVNGSKGTILRLERGTPAVSETLRVTPCYALPDLSNLACRNHFMTTCTVQLIVDVLSPLDCGQGSGRSLFLSH